MTEGSVGLWHDYTITYKGTQPASPDDKTGILGLAFVPSEVFTDANAAEITISGATPIAAFKVIDLTETAQSTDPNVKYKGGIQSVDKGVTGNPILIPIPEEFQTGFDIGFIESAVFTISGVWFDGLDGRDKYFEDLRTSKKIVHANHRQSPYILLLSNRAYPVFITGYSSNIVGGQGNIISIRLGLSISSLNGHYNYTG